MKKNNIFITGTDTNIGKTVLSFLIMAYFFKIGKDPFYLKPFQTGCKTPFDEGSDAKFIYNNISNLKEKNLKESVIYCLKNPKAPLFAATDDNVNLNIDNVFKIIDEKNKIFNPIIIEGAGGLFVPVDEKTMMIDIVEKIDAKIVLAARAGLGTINHTLLSIEALKARGILKPAIVFLNHKNQSVSDEILKENIKAVEMFSGIKVAGVINHIDDFTDIDAHSLTTIKTVLSTE